MATLIIKDFPDPLYRFLKIQAALQDTTIKQVVIDIVGSACLRIGASEAELAGDKVTKTLYEKALDHIQAESIKRIKDALERNENTET